MQLFMATMPFKEKSFYIFHSAFLSDRAYSRQRKSSGRNSALKLRRKFWQTSRLYHAFGVFTPLIGMDIVRIVVSCSFQVVAVITVQS